MDVEAQEDFEDGDMNDEGMNDFVMKGDEEMQIRGYVVNANQKPKVNNLEIVKFVMANYANVNINGQVLLQWSPTGKWNIMGFLLFRVIPHV